MSVGTSTTPPAAASTPSQPPVVVKTSAGQKISKAFNNQKVKNVVAALFSVIVLGTGGLAALLLMNKSAKNYISAGMPDALNTAASAIANKASSAASAVSGLFKKKPTLPGKAFAI